MPAKKDNLSLVLHKPGDLRLEQVPPPSKPGPGEILLKTLSVGICGSDVHYWTHGAIGDFVVKAPMILGHETSAQVEDVGEGVTNLKRGDMVAIEPGTSCRACSYCKEGKYNLCPEMTFHATPPYDGTLTRYFKHPADLCFKLPSTMTPDEGALLEPLSVGVYSCQRADIKVGESILVCGAGPIGLVTIMAAKAFGASKICVTDINESRLSVAKEIGATTTILLKVGETPEETSKRVIEALGGNQPDKTIDCVGAQSTITLALLTTKSGGVLVLTGMAQNTVTVPLITATCREVDIRGVFRYKNTWPLCLQLIREGRIDVKKLVTHRFRLEESLDAFEVAKSGAGIKVIIDCDRKGG